MPTPLARVIIEYSFSETPAKRVEGSFTIHDPPTPVTGMVRPPRAFSTAENFS